MKRQRFEAELYQGHSGDLAVAVPFDPNGAWEERPRKIGYRNHVGHAVRGSVDGARFEGWIWFYWKGFVMVVPDVALEKTKAVPGDVVKVSVEPHPDPARVPPFKPKPNKRASTRRRRAS